MSSSKGTKLVIKSFASRSCPDCLWLERLYIQYFQAGITSHCLQTWKSSAPKLYFQIDRTEDTQDQMHRLLAIDLSDGLHVVTRICTRNSLPSFCATPNNGVRTGEPASRRTSRQIMAPFFLGIALSNGFQEGNNIFRRGQRISSR